MNNYVHKFYNTDEMDQFFERHNLPKLTQEKTDNMNRSIFIKENELATNNFPKRVSPDP